MAENKKELLDKAVGELKALGVLGRENKSTKKDNAKLVAEMENFNKSIQSEISASSEKLPTEDKDKLSKEINIRYISQLLIYKDMSNTLLQSLQYMKIALNGVKNCNENLHTYKTPQELAEKVLEMLELVEKCVKSNDKLDLDTLIEDIPKLI